MKFKQNCLKSGEPTLELKIFELLIQISSMCRMPTEWEEDLLIPIHKKDDKQNCANWRPILLINTAYKILALLINTVFQAGFREQRSMAEPLILFEGN